MNYILRYKIRSKYFRFTREIEKEFDRGTDVYRYIIENQIKDYIIYGEVEKVIRGWGKVVLENLKLKEDIERQSKAQVILDDEITERDTRIDKAIEVIEEEVIPYDAELYEEYQKIIDILKGSDSNE